MYLVWKYGKKPLDLSIQEGFVLIKDDTEKIIKKNNTWNSFVTKYTRQERD